MYGSHYCSFDKAEGAKEDWGKWAVAEGTGDEHHRLWTACQCMALHFMNHLIYCSQMVSKWGGHFSSSQMKKWKLGEIDHLPQIMLYNRLSNFESRIPFS